jgi:hypothetical protein
MKANSPARTYACALGHITASLKLPMIASSVPIGFISDYIEVLYDPDVEAHQLCRDLGLLMTRAKTVQMHSDFIRMIRELILERGGRTYPSCGDSTE